MSGLTGRPWSTRNIRLPLRDTGCVPVASNVRAHQISPCIAVAITSCQTICRRPPRHSGSIRMLSRITLVSFFLLICAPVFAGPKEPMVSNALQGEELSELQAQEEMF